MNGHYHFGFKNNATVNEPVLADAIAAAKKVRSPITAVGFVCTYGCGKLHPLSKEELQVVGKRFRKLPTMDWMSCAGVPEVAPLGRSYKYSITFHDGQHLTFPVLDQAAASQVKAVQSEAMLAAVVDAQGVIVRHFLEQEHARLTALMGRPLVVHSSGIYGGSDSLLLLQKDGRRWHSTVTVWDPKWFPQEFNGAELLLGYLTNTRLEYCAEIGRLALKMLEEFGVKVSGQYLANLDAIHPDHGCIVVREGQLDTWHHSLDLFLVDQCRQGGAFQVRSFGKSGPSKTQIKVTQWFLELTHKLAEVPLPKVNPEGGRDNLAEQAAQKEPRLPALVSHCYHAAYLDGNLECSSKLDSEFVNRLKSRNGLQLFHVATKAEGEFVRGLSGDERRELIRLGYDVRGELKKGAQTVPKLEVDLNSGHATSQLEPVRPPGVQIPEAMQPAILVTCPDGVKRRVTEQQLENLLSAVAGVYTDAQMIAAAMRYGSSMPVSTFRLESCMDDIYDHKKA